MPMKAKIIGLIIGIVVLGGLIISSLSQQPAEQTLTATTTATTTVATSTATTTQNTNTSSSKPSQPTPKPTPAPAPAPAPQPTVKTFTSAQVTMHNNESSCYTIIEGKVYDLTSWISQHPGGERAILSICGKDGTAAYEGQHGGESRPEKILATFYIGELAQ